LHFSVLLLASPLVRETSPLAYRVISIVTWVFIIYSIQNTGAHRSEGEGKEEATRKNEAERTGKARNFKEKTEGCLHEAADLLVFALQALT
jgi:hypothetical protein